MTDLSLKMMNSALKKDGFCIKNDGFCIKNDGFSELTLLDVVDIGGKVPRGFCVVRMFGIFNRRKRRI